LLKVGLTGGLASGKSTVAEILAELGAAVFDADDIVRGLYRDGAAGAEAARELFGDRILGDDGRIDRVRIAAIVFTSPEARHALEARIHPLVREERARLFQEAERRGAKVAVVEASQLFESGTESDYDRTVLVVAPESERFKRWELKGGDAEDGRRRAAAQISPDAAKRRARDIVVNDGSLEDLRQKVTELYRRWTP
jgi:dephospho-CoA kinase